MCSYIDKMHCFSVFLRSLLYRGPISDPMWVGVGGCKRKGNCPITADICDRTLFSKVCFLYNARCAVQGRTSL